MNSFGLSSAISKVSVADFEHVFVCWEKYRITIAVLQILEIPNPTNKYSKSTTETVTVAYPEDFRHWYTGLGTQIMCPN